MAKRQQKKTTAESVIPSRKLDHLMMLISGMMAETKGKPDIAKTVAAAMEQRDQIYQQIDVEHKKVSTVSNTGSKKKLGVEKTTLMNRITGKPEPRVQR